MRPKPHDVLQPALALLQSYGWMLAVLLAAFIAWQAGSRWARGAWRRLRMRRRFARAQRAEDAAAKVLARSGYKVLDSQPELSWIVRLDRRAYTVDIRADYLVKRGRKRYIAEVKTGNHAPSITTSATRRQLLEYMMAYPVDGVLLVDMEDESIYHVDFSGLQNMSAPSNAAFLRGALAGLIAGAALIYALLQR
jgi:hypothetical protein